MWVALNIDPQFGPMPTSAATSIWNATVTATSPYTALLEFLLLLLYQIAVYLLVIFLVFILLEFDL